MNEEVSKNRDLGGDNFDNYSWLEITRAGSKIARAELSRAERPLA